MRPRSNFIAASRRSVRIRPDPAEPWQRLPPRLLQELADALKGRWKKYRKQFRDCRSRFSEKGVHDLRVETRRLLALLALLEPFLGKDLKLERLLKHTLDHFSELRDTQVQLQEVEQLCKRFSAARLFHRHLLKREKQCARCAQKKIRQIKTTRLARLMAKARADLKQQCQERPASSVARMLAGVAWRAFERTCALRERIDPRNTRTIHRTRVAFKKYRYIMETLAGYMPQLNVVSLERMHDYQGLMGEVQDSNVLLSAVIEYCHDRGMESKASIRFQSELERRRQRLTVRYLTRADRLYNFSYESLYSAPRPGWRASRARRRFQTAAHAQGQKKAPPNRQSHGGNGAVVRSDS